MSQAVNAGSMAASAVHAQPTARGSSTIAIRGAMLGLFAGIVIAIPLAASAGLSVFIATALDVGAGLAMIGALIGANVAGTD